MGSWPRLSVQVWPRIGLVLCLIALNTALIVFSFKMYPVDRGTPEGFFDAMYDLKLSPDRGMGSVYPSQGRRCIYFHQGFHREFLYAVSMGEVEALLPKVRVRASRECTSLSEEERTLLDSESSINELVHARIETWAKRAASASPESGEYFTERQRGFLSRWARIERYWANILFEAVYLNGSLVVVWVPFLMKGALVRRAIAIGLAFPLLLAPYFLGYCPWSFTSAGPVGGVLYPILLLPFYGWPVGWNDFDVWLVGLLGSPLSSLSQGTGGMLSVSGMGSVTPTSTLIGGLLSAIATFLGSRAAGRALRGNPAG
jgi:hypothetical protein